METTPLRLNIAGGPKKLPGYTNVDALEWGGATDVLHDLTAFPYPFADSSAEAILSEETLEHLSFRVAPQFMAELYRILKPGGTLCVQVPDIGLMCEYYARGQVCACVPRKAASYDLYRADPSCTRCGGNGKVHPERWLFAFTGAQKHEYDFHRNHLTAASLKALAEHAGFVDVEVKPNVYKAIINATKKKLW